MHPDVRLPLRVPLRVAGVLRPAARVYVPVRPLDPEFDEPFFFRGRSANSSVRSPVGPERSLPTRG